MTLNKSSKRRGLGVVVGGERRDVQDQDDEPKRYSVRPNVGVAWPGADAEVAQPGLKEPPQVQGQVPGACCRCRRALAAAEGVAESHRALLNEI